MNYWRWQDVLAGLQALLIGAFIVIVYRGCNEYSREEAEYNARSKKEWAACEAKCAPHVTLGPRVSGCECDLSKTIVGQ